MDQQDGRRVVDIELGCTGGGAVEPTRCCAVCAEPLAWVTVGSCGHGVVCPRCMVRVRFVEDDRCCIVCGADCPSVIVAKAADSTRRGGPVVPALSPPPASKEGNVGEYWYHGDTAAYFHDEQQYEEARDACNKTRLRNLLTWFMFVFLFGCSIGIGAPMSNAVVRDMKGTPTAMKVLGYALGMCISPLPVVCILFIAWRCNTD